MARVTVPPLDQQVARVRLRLFLQTLLNHLMVCWLGALVVAALWFLVQPFFLSVVVPYLRWAVLGGLLGAGTLLACFLAYVRTPNLLTSALYLDERFHLKERVTTGLTLTAAEANSPVGQALLADANRRVLPLRVGERFPVRLPWTAALVPLGALLLTLLALFYKPQFGQAKDEEKQPLTANQAAADDIKEQLKQLQKKGQPRQKDLSKSKELEKLEEERDKLAHAKTETREQAKEAVKEMGNLEEQMQKRDKELAQRMDALKERAKQAERLAKKEKLDGPANKMDRALQQADFKKAKEEAEQLAKQLEQEEKAEQLRRKLEDPNLNEAERDRLKKELEKLEKNKLAPEEKKKLREQLKDLQKQVERLSRNLKEREQDLEKLEEMGDLTREELERELEQMRQDAEKIDPETLKKLRELAQKIGECEQCLREGKDAEAAEKLQEAANMLDKLDPGEEREELAKQIQMLRDCRRIICEALEGGGIGSGRRPLGDDGKTNHQETRERATMTKGQKQVIDHVPGDGFKGPRMPAELTEEIRQAAQEAPEAIDRQRLPRSASDMARGYFEKLRGPDKKDKKEP